MSELIVLVLIATYFTAGAIKGTLGIGFPTASIALSATVYDARTAITYAIIPMCLINAWQIYRSGNVAHIFKANWRLLLAMVIFIAIFTVASADISIYALTLFLGVAISVFALTSLWRTPPVLPDRYNNPAQIFTGVIAGIFGGLAGVWAPPIIIYLTSRRVSSTEFVQTVGILLFIGSTILLGGYVYNGLIHTGNAVFSTLLVLPAIAGFTLGEILRRKLSNDLFFKIILMFFLVLGLNFIRRALSM